MPANAGKRRAAEVLAQAAADAFEWGLARRRSLRSPKTAPRQGVCVLMAEIEEGQNADQGKAREWLARAVKAPRDPAWTADGLALDEWQPVSPVSGKFDVFVWQVPADGPPGRVAPLPPAVEPPALPAATQGGAAATP